MGSLRQAGKMITLVVVTCILIYIGARAFSVFTKGYSWKEMDWNGDGKTSLAELLESSDIDYRSIRRDSVECIEYYRLKDGLPVKVSCPTARPPH